MCALRMRVRGFDEGMLHTRACEHIGRSHCTGLSLASPRHSNDRFNGDKCSLSVYDWNFRVLLGCEPNHESLLNLESLYICEFKHGINDMRNEHKFLFVH